MGQFPNPSTQFQKGQSGNPGGKSAAQRQAEVEAAEIAAKLRLKALKELAKDEGEIMERLDAVLLKLFKDSEDRAHGTPAQSVKHEGTGEGGAIVFKTVYEDKAD